MTENYKKEELINIEIEFNKHLAKVYDLGSYKGATENCKKMIREHWRSS